MTQETNLQAAAPAGGLVPYDYNQFEGTGFENTSEKDLSIPFLEILQKNSKALTKGEAKFVPGAEAGMFLNINTRELIPGDKGFALVPLHVDHCVVEWTSARQFVARRQLTDPVWLEAKERFEKNTNPDKKIQKDVKSPAGNSMVETYYLWALLLDETGEQPVSGVILPFKSTNIGIYRKQVYTPLYSFKGAGGKLFVHRLRCTLASETRPDGTSFNYRFAPLKGTIKDSLVDPKSELMAAIYKTYRNVVEGKAKMAEPDETTGGGDAETADPAFA